MKTEMEINEAVVIITRVKHNFSPEMLLTLMRASLDQDEKILASAPKTEPRMMSLFYFQAKNINSHDALAKEYERRNLKPAEPLALLDAYTQAETPTELFLTKNGLTHWKDKFGQWRHIRFTLNSMILLCMLQDVVTPEDLFKFEKLILDDCDDKFGDDQWFVGVE